MEQEPDRNESPDGAAGAPGGQPGNPGKTGRDELERRIEFTIFLLFRRLPKGKVKQQLRSMYKVDARTAERYLARARRRLVEESGRPQEEHRLDALRFFESVVSGPDATLSERMHAQAEICHLLGLYAPKRLAHGGDAGAPPIKTEDSGAIDWSKATLEELKAARELVLAVKGRTEAGRNGHAAEPGRA